MSILLVIGILWTFYAATRLAIAKRELAKTRLTVPIPGRVKRFSRRHSL